MVYGISCNSGNFIPVSYLLGGGDTGTDSNWDNEKRKKTEDKTRNKVKRLEREGLERWEVKKRR